MDLSATASLTSVSPSPSNPHRARHKAWAEGLMEGEYRREGGAIVRRWKREWMVGKRVEGGREPSRREEKGKARRRRIL